MDWTLNDIMCTDEEGQGHRDVRLRVTSMYTFALCSLLFLSLIKRSYLGSYYFFFSAFSHHVSIDETAYSVQLFDTPFHAFILCMVLYCTVLYLR